MTERRWAGLTPERRAAPLHYSFPMTKQGICLFSCLFFAIALLQSQLSLAWKTLGLSQHMMCLRAGGYHFWCKLQPGDRADGAVSGSASSGQSCSSVFISQYPISVLLTQRSPVFLDPLFIMLLNLVSTLIFSIIE